MTKPYRPPLAHRVAIPRSYVPAVATDIRKTIAAERKRLAAARKAASAPKGFPLWRAAA